MRVKETESARDRTRVSQRAIVSKSEPERARESQRELSSQVHCLQSHPARNWEGCWLTNRNNEREIGAVVS